MKTYQNNTKYTIQFYIHHTEGSDYDEWKKITQLLRKS